MLGGMRLEGRLKPADRLRHCGQGMCWVRAAWMLQVCRLVGRQMQAERLRR